MDKHAGAVAGDGGDAAPVSAPSVFLSYSRTDLERARPVIALLEGAGFDVWWDGRLEGGENYLATTENALEAADCVAVLWSQTSVASHWVRDEAQRGRERGCLVPLSLDGTMAPLGFRQFQLLDIAGWSGDPADALAARILVAVRTRAGQSAAAGEAPAVTAPAPPAATPGLAVSRRALMIGGAGLVGTAALFGVWKSGLLSGGGSQAISMVVLPFANLTGDVSKAWFSNGLSNELRAVLVRNPRLRVAAPTSSVALDGEDEFAIGRKLGVEHILRGSVQRDDTRMRVSAELVQIEGGTVRWAETYDRPLSDVFALQTEIAETVALSLVAQTVGESEARSSLEAQQAVGGTQDIAAYEAFLRGHALYDLSAGAQTDRAALEQFDTAIAKDPGYAAAHAMRSTMLAAIANTANTAEEARGLFVQAIAAAERAIALEDRLAQGHLALGFALNNGQLKRAKAMVHYRKAEKLAPGDADALRQVATFYSFGTEIDLAQQMIKRVIDLDPLNARTFRSAGFVNLFARDYAGAIAQMQRALQINQSLASAHFVIANARLMQGDAVGALAAAKAEPVAQFALTMTAIAAHKLGDTAKADAEYAKLLADYGDAALYQQAQVLAQRGEGSGAVARLQAAYAAGDSGMLLARNDPMLDPIRSDPKLGELLSKLGS
ncbi:MAG: TIR domain-containing protein [Erythrobacter sp.]|jgi:TolB-like protein/Tfp pilus assembly protein PilF|uniref:TIR domain-containing protein n=1 Tax=Erythrobacter sp. TaxID=1042 RepID=UPI002B4986E1|nr:TIR domain-containing protein [Erythrobacter sp.]WRH69434.1 MAG: TIR domain-containing protein [Erythrobacter sp.]